jgi:hypothetical protein
VQKTLIQAVLFLVMAVPAFGQAVSSWLTLHQLPVAVVEVPGGDVEHLAAVLPADASPPDEVAGFPGQVTPRRGALLWSVRVPALLVQPALAEFARTLTATGAAAVVALGPVPSRELEGPLAMLESVPNRPLARVPCVLADGGVEVRRGTPERVNLTLALPGPEDPRYDQIPAFTAWVQVRLAAAFPDVRVESDLQGGCARLVVQTPAGDEHPRLTLRRLRGSLAGLAAATPTPDEVNRALAVSQARIGEAEVAGGAVARQLAERLAFGGGVAGALTSPTVDAATLGLLGRRILAGHAGFASLTEQERRAQGEALKTLENGVVVTVRWIPGEIGVVAVALGGFDPRVGKGVLSAAADLASRQGWTANVGEMSGVPTLALAVPAAQVTDVLERVSDVLSGPRPPVEDDLALAVAHALGLADHVTAEAVSVALALPPEVEEGGEAAEKFFSNLQAGGVRSGAAALNPGLAWKPGDGAPEEAGVVELPATPAGVAVGQIMHDRLGSEAGVHTLTLAPPGRLLLVVTGEGGAHVPELDARLATIWQNVRRPAQAAEVGAAARRVLTIFYGDAAQATARTAAAVFLPVVPTDAELLGLDPREVSATIAALPAWDKVVRFARGRAPQVAVPPPRKGSVRKSSPPGI